MPIVFDEEVYFTVDEAAAPTVVPFRTMHRWAREAERGITSWQVENPDINAPGGRG